MISTQEFAKATNFRKSRSPLTGFRKSSSALASIYDDLRALEGLPKTNLEARWQLLSKLAAKCDLYIEGKRGKGKDLGKAKYAVIERLGSGSFGQLAKEKASATRHHGAMQSSGRGIAPGVNNPHHTQVKFERALILTKGIHAGKTFHGQNLYDMAAADGVTFTGDEMMNAYKLRAYFKANLDRLLKEDNELLEFVNSDQERAQYTLNFHNDKVRQGGGVFTTVGSSAGVKDDAFCVVDPDGNWYAAPGKSLRGGWHHTSFLAGGDAMFAGTISVSGQGTPRFISNASGHYAPEFDDLVHAIDSLRTSGLNQATLSKMSVYYQDFKNEFGGGNSLFPLLQLGGAKKRFPVPLNYALTVDNFGNMKWKTPGAGRHPNSPGSDQAGAINFPA